ncbi:hypothetical protein ABPG77_004652 [Micractinium sp. CCAP 211/92]
MAPRPPAGFADALIAALRDAEAAAARPKAPATLAEAAWSKLQFDFPMVSAEELSALAQEYASGARSAVSVRFLSVVREGASAAATPAGSEPVPPQNGSDGVAHAAAASPLVALYQRLYAVAVLQSLQSCLESPEAAAAGMLADLAAEPVPSVGMHGDQQFASQLEAALSAAGEAPRIEKEHRLSQQEDDDSATYEPLEPAAQQHAAQLPLQLQQRPQHQLAGRQAASQAALPERLAQLADHLSYPLMADAAAWRELGLMQRVAGCLAAARRHPRWAELQAAAQLLLRLAVDRLVACPAELEAALAALLDALAIPGGAGSGSGSSSSGCSPSANGKLASKQAAALAAELALAAAVALAAQVSSPSARRRLWTSTHTRLLTVAAAQLEAEQVVLARATRGAAAAAAGDADHPVEVQVPPGQLYRIMLPCQLLYFYVLEAPRVGAGPASSTQLQEAFLRGGLLRALVLLFCQLGGQAGAEPLRCALLLACTAAQPLADWARAVPGFAAAVGSPALAPGGDAALHGALWRLLLGSGGSELAALLRDATPAEKVPGVLQALQLMADMQAVTRRTTPLWDSDVEAALRTLAVTLRQHYSRQRLEEQAAAATQTGASAASQETRRAPVQMQQPHQQDKEEEDKEGEEEEEARKLGRPAEEQAAVLAARHAARLQPACLKLIKDLLQLRGGGGKHD